MPPSEGPGYVEVETRSFSYGAGQPKAVSICAVAVEAPVQIVIGGSPFAIMMATPCDLEDFAYGFALTEGIARTTEDIRGVEVEGAPEGFRVRLALRGETLQQHLARKRALSGRTGCGLCGIEDFDEMPKPPPLEAVGRPIEGAAVSRALAALESRQPLNAATHAVHAAAWCTPAGDIEVVREDVGRHNALDKAIGALWRASADPSKGFFVITSRCSFEMVAKTAIFGARTLVAVSAPTSLALERARAFGVMVIAVARADKALAFETRAGQADGGLAA